MGVTRPDTSALAAGNGLPPAVLVGAASANAVSVVRSLPGRKVLFTPDRNLGRWVAAQVPESYRHAF